MSAASDRPALIRRVTAADGTDVHFTTPHGARTGRCPLQFFRRTDVPPFEGPEAWFAVERARGGVRILRLLHQVEPPAGYVPTPPPRRAGGFPADIDAPIPGPGAPAEPTGHLRRDFWDSEP